MLCGVVGHRAVAVDRDGDRAHSQESEGDETKREDRDRRTRAGVQQ